MVDKEVCVWDEKEAVEKITNTLVPKADTSTHSLRDTTAQPGNARGIARIIINGADFHKMQPNDVLITTMTTPDFVLLMQRSWANMTDIVGLLSHAAIVSRELKKPCVIGTKFATQVFKDGEMLEVDATDGTVTRIEK